ncbi:MAG: sugar-binding domain-containing protein [Microbacterium sp.]
MSGIEADARTREALHVAQLYYEQDRTMEQIAAELNVSRSSVSRLLSYAREIGLVEITVHSPQQGSTAVARRVAEALRHLGARRELAPAHARHRSSSARLGRRRALSPRRSTPMHPSASPGARRCRRSRGTCRRRLYNSQIVQMNGAANEITSGIACSGAILERLSVRGFGADVQQFPVPALFDDPSTKQLMWRERSVRRVLDAQERVRRCSCSGSRSPTADVPSHVYSGGYLSGDDLHSLMRDGIVGGCATVFYRIAVGHPSERALERKAEPRRSGGFRGACAPCRACQSSIAR